MVDSVESMQLDEDNPMNAATILTVRLDDRVICEATAADAPREFTARVRLRAEQSLLRIEQPAATPLRHSLPFESGQMDLTIRLHPSLACEIDASVADRRIRFQPVILDASDVARPDVEGRGLFGRGLLLAGDVTPSNVSLGCLCDRCAGSFRLQPFHAGFSNIGYFYSASGLHTLVVSADVEGAPVPFSDPDPVALAALEARLPPAPDGTRFSYLHPLRCPHCAAPYIDFAAHPEIRANEYYGTTFFGVTATTYRG